MVRSLLALITLSGLNVFIWGCMGVCRLIHEKAGHSSRPVVAMTLATLMAALGIVIMLELSLEPLMGLTSAMLDHLQLKRSTKAVIFTVVVPVWIVLCGAAACYLGLFLARGRAWRRARGGNESAPPHGAGASSRMRPDDVAILIAAYNEEASIRACLEAAARIVPKSNIFVGSDGSTDRTVAIAGEQGCNVLDIQPNRGKARALATLIEHFAIRARFQAVLLLDADSEIDEHYLERALPLLDDPLNVAVAGHAIPKSYPHVWPKWSMFFTAYRFRLYRITQAFLRYGQTWHHANVSFIVPGFASMYRCSVLPHIDITAPGLIIEDFNMTFELHHKRLGKIAYSPGVRCASHEPHSLRDFFKQVRRWHLGFWQTIRLHGIWASAFWLSLATFVIEVLLQSLVFLAVPVFLVWFLIEAGQPVMVWLPTLGMTELTLLDMVIGVFLADYALTLLVSVVDRKPLLLFYGLGFSLLRWIDTFLFLYTLPLAFVEKSDGRWVSPKRGLQ